MRPTVADGLRLAVVRLMTGLAVSPAVSWASALEHHITGPDRGRIHSQIFSRKSPARVIGLYGSFSTLHTRPLAAAQVQGPAPRDFNPPYAVRPCSSPTSKQSWRRASKHRGYDGRLIVVPHVTEIPFMNAAAIVTRQRLESISSSRTWNALCCRPRPVAEAYHAEVVAATTQHITGLMQCNKNLGYNHLVSDRSEPGRRQSLPEPLHFDEGGISSFRLLEQGRNPRLLAT